MGYILDGTTIKRPNKIRETNSTQTAENRTLSGNVTRDLFGSNKRVWELEYNNVKTTEFSIIQTIYNSYLSTKTAKSFQSTETNYAISATTVHVDLRQRGFSVQGSSYVSDFTLILKEA